jgi:hypothetical protein
VCEFCGGGEQQRFGTLLPNRKKCPSNPPIHLLDRTGMGSTLSLCAIQDGVWLCACACVPPPPAAKRSGGSCTVSILKDSFAILCQAVIVSLPSPPLDTMSQSCSTLGIEFGIGSRPCSNRTGRDWRVFLEFGEDACEVICTPKTPPSSPLEAILEGANSASGKSPNEIGRLASWWFWILTKRQLGGPTGGC